MSTRVTITITSPTVGIANAGQGLPRPFAVGSTSNQARTQSRPRSANASNNVDSISARRPVRQAAVQASARIESLANSGCRAKRVASGAKERPIDLLDDDSVDEDDEKKPAAIVASAPGAVASATVEEGIQCAICLDSPEVGEAATISGCTHRFCFGCIERWAETENRCPCCKERFRTIQRIVTASSTAERRNKRKRDASSSSSSSRRRTNPAPARVDSRTVEDRNQQSLSSFGFNIEMFEQFMNSLGPRQGGEFRISGPGRLEIHGNGPFQIRGRGNDDGSVVMNRIMEIFDRMSERAAGRQGGFTIAVPGGRVRNESNSTASPRLQRVRAPARASRERNADIEPRRSSSRRTRRGENQRREQGGSSADDALEIE